MVGHKYTEEEHKFLQFFIPPETSQLPLSERLLPWLLLILSFRLSLLPLRLPPRLLFSDFSFKKSLRFAKAFLFYTSGEMCGHNPNPPPHNKDP